MRGSSFWLASRFPEKFWIVAEDSANSGHPWLLTDSVRDRLHHLVPAIAQNGGMGEGMAVGDESRSEMRSPIIGSGEPHPS